MSGRTEMLDALRRNQPPATPLPASVVSARPDGDPAERFAELVRAIGGHIVHGISLDAVIALHYPHAVAVASMVAGVATWLSDARLGHRAAPFLAQHMLLVLDCRRIVWDMHAAYEQVKVDAEGFGIFVAGPSKTADIEQALVIGAHGPRSLVILLTDGG